MDFLKKFQNVENYTDFVNSDYFKLPNVSLTDEDYDVHYTNFISQGGEEEEETEPAVTLTYKVNRPEERVAFWNGGENIKRLYVDGEEIPFDPVEIVSETTEIPGSTFVFDGDTVTCPDSCFLTSVPSRITLTPKDSSVQINNDTEFLFIVRNLLEDNYTWVGFDDFIPSAGVGSVIDNKLVMDNPGFLSFINDLISDDCVVTFALINGYSNAPVALEADIDTASAEPEIQVLDIIMTAEVITGGVQTPFLFDYPGQHTVKMVLNDTDFGGNRMFSYYEDEVQENSLLTNSPENYCALQSVVINDKVTSILPGTFYQSSLYKVKIGSSVTSIGEGAFFESNIETVIIPDSVTRIDDYAFQYCYDLRFVKFSKNLTTIGTRAFESTWIGDVDLPASITYIGEHAFRNCGAINSVRINSNGDTVIGYRAFYNCYNLRQLTLAEGITRIGDYAFDSTNITNIELPDSVVELGYTPFHSNIETIKLGAGITSIPNAMFRYYYNLKSVEIGEGCTSIGNEAFRGCSGLTSVEIPDSVTSIGNNAFSDCKGLTSVEIGSGVTSIGDDVFYNCSGLTSVVIPDSVTSIGNNAFSDCKGLTSVVIPDSVTSIGNYAFYKCSGLKKITCHAVTAPSIQSYTFYNVSTLGKLIYPEGSDYSSWLSTNSYYLGYYKWNQKAGTIVATYNVTDTTNQTRLCNTKSNLYSVYKIDGVRVTGDTSFTAYTFDTVGEHTVTFKEMEIVSSMFSSTPCLKSVKINKDITSIGNNAFDDCDGLTSVEIGSGMTSIGTFAFSGCTNLTSIVIPDSVTSIGGSAFSECTSLPVIDNIRYADTYCVGTIDNTITSFSLKEGTKWIGSGAFSSCTGLTGELVIPDSVTSISGYAFYKCSGLTSVVIPDSVTSIGEYAFYQCSGLTGELIIPDSVTSIGLYVFQYCSGLTSVEIGSGVTSIAAFAFSDCYGLTGEIVIPDSVTRIDQSVFSNCSGLTSVVIGSGVTSIGNYAFHSCSKLNKITCHAATAPSISSQTFYGVKNYGYLKYPEGSNYNSWLSANNYYLGYYKWDDEISVINCTYNVITTDSVTQLLNYATYVISMTVDGVNISPSATYQFNSIGEHHVEIGIVKVITDNLFKGCSDLTSVVIPDSVTSINNQAFNQCSGLESIIVSSGNTVYDSRENCNCIIRTSTNNLLYGCKNSFIPDSVTSIGDYAFYQCSGLTGELVIPDSVKTLNWCAFSYCSGLTSVVIPNSVTSIGSQVFSGCSGLTSLEIGSGVTSIETSAFSGCTNLTGELIIPDSVTSIGGYAFYGCSKLTGDLVIPDSVTSIYNYTFYQCSGLTSVVIPDSVKSIGNHAFYQCSGLTNVEIGNGCTSIGNSAFYGCSGLTSLEIGSGVTSIDTSVFRFCPGLESIIVSSGNTVYDSRENCNCIIETSTNTLMKGGNNSVIPDSVTIIGSMAFNGCSGLTSVIIPDSVTKIYSDAFSSCSGLTSIEIGSGVTSISSYVFSGCGKLTEITCHATTAPSLGSSVFNMIKTGGILYVPSGSDYSSWMGTDYKLGHYNWFICEIGTELPEFELDGYDVAMLVQPLTNSSVTKICNKTTSIAEIKVNDTVLTSVSTGYTFSDPYEWNIVRIKYTDGVASIPSSGFSGCARIYDVKIAGSVTSIGYQAFYQCKGLTSVVIGNSVTSIGSEAFEQCSDLTSVVIGNGCTSISQDAFSYCYGLTSVVIPDSVKSIGSYAFEKCSGLTSVEIGSGVTSIGYGAFRECSSLTSVVIPDSVQSINGGTFNKCSGLESIIVSSGNTVYDSRENCNCIIRTSTNTLIQGCKNSFIPVSVTSIGDDAFSYCYGLTSVVIPDSVTSIGEDAFWGCSELTSIEIPDSVTSIGDSAFNGCSGLTSVEIGSGVTSIGKSAFNGCTGLTGELVIPDSVTSIGNNAFLSCSRLTSVVIPDSVTSIGDSAFNGCSGLTGELIIPDSVTSIGKSAFNGCSGLTGELVIPDSVTSIGNYAFYQCSGLISLEIGSGVTSIGDDAFQECSSLTGELVIPDSVTSIGYGAFRDCSGLTGELVIPDSVTSISGYTFDTCKGLTSVVIGSGCTSISSYAFHHCSGLTEITCRATTAPSISSTTFDGMQTGGILYVPAGSDYSSWMSANSYYLGYYNWTLQVMYSPTECTSLSITADDVDGRATKTTIYWTAVTNGVDFDGNPINNITITGETISSEFPQNTSETETVERTITFEYMGVTASTTITQGVWPKQNYTVNLNNQWQLNTNIANPDSAVYEGVYESFSNKGVNNSAAIMYIDIVGYENFKLYVRSNAESSYDYVVVSNLDNTLSSGTTSGSNVKMTTSGKQNSGTAISNYTLVEFTGIDGDEHRISVMYRKDSSTSSGTDQGYVLIPKNQ